MTPEMETRLFTTLGRIEQKIDGHMKEDAATFARHERQLGDQGAAVADLEKFRARTRGVTKGATAVVAVAATIATFVAKAKGLL